MDEISRNFSKLRGRPHDFEANLEEADPAPLPALAAERIAQEAEKKGTVPSQKMQLSEASVYCGESSFGHAPKVGISIEDMKQSLLNAERFTHCYHSYRNFISIGSIVPNHCYFEDLRQDPVAVWHLEWSMYHSL